MTRRILPQRRFAETFGLAHGPHRFFVSIGYFDDAHEPAEIFVTGTKAGSEIEAISRDGAVLLSLALQHGVPVQTIAHAVTRDGNGGAASIIGALADQLAALANGSPSRADQDSQIKIGKSNSADWSPRALARAKGGHARAASLTAEQRKTIASKAAAARWARARLRNIPICSKAIEP